MITLEVVHFFRSIAFYNNIVFQPNLLVIFFLYLLICLINFHPFLLLSIPSFLLPFFLYLSPFPVFLLFLLMVLCYFFSYFLFIR